jgi:hypothetical protein
MTRAAVPLIILAASLTSGCGNTSKFLAKCETLGATGRLDYTLVFDVDHRDMVDFNNAVMSYFKKQGLTYGSGVNDSYLSPPDTKGQQIRFTNFNTVGCTYRSLIWSDNVISERQFIVTISRTIFGNAEASARHARELSEIGRSVSKKPVKIKRW